MSDAFTKQVQDFTKQAQEMFTAGKDAKVPENISAFAEDAVAKSRDAFHKVSAAAKDNAKVVEDVMLTTQAGAKSIGEKIIAEHACKHRSRFRSRSAIARARTFPEIARLQANYFQQQFASSARSRRNSSNCRARLLSRHSTPSVRQLPSRSNRSRPRLNLACCIGLIPPSLLHWPDKIHKIGHPGTPAAPFSLVFCF